MQNSQTFIQSGPQFPFFQIYPQNYQFYQSVAYNLKFTNTYTINSYLYLELQQNIQYAYCQNLTCVPYQNGLKITFNESVFPGNHEVLIYNVQNPDYSGIFSYSLSNPGIESAIFAHYTIFTCPDNCQNCTLQQNGQVQCTQCQSGYEGQNCTKKISVTQNTTICPSKCTQCKESICQICSTGYSLHLGVCAQDISNVQEQTYQKRSIQQSYYLLSLTLAIVALCIIIKIRKSETYYFHMFISLIQSYELIADLIMTLELGFIGTNLFFVALTQVIFRQVQLLTLNPSLNTQLQNTTGTIYKILKISSIYYSWKTIFIFSTRLSNRLKHTMQFNQVLMIDTFTRAILLVGLGLNYEIINLDYVYFLSISLGHQMILLCNQRVEDKRLLRKLSNV